jgi:hypothetical protein
MTIRRWRTVVCDDQVLPGVDGVLYKLLLFERKQKWLEALSRCLDEEYCVPEEVAPYPSTETQASARRKCLSQDRAPILEVTRTLTESWNLLHSTEVRFAPDVVFLDLRFSGSEAREKTGELDQIKREVVLAVGEGEWNPPDEVFLDDGGWILSGLVQRLFGHLSVRPATILYTADLPKRLLYKPLQYALPDLRVVPKQKTATEDDVRGFFDRLIVSWLDRHILHVDALESCAKAIRQLAVVVKARERSSVGLLLKKLVRWQLGSGWVFGTLFVWRVQALHSLNAKLIDEVADELDQFVRNINFGRALMAALHDSILRVCRHGDDDEVYYKSLPSWLSGSVEEQFRRGGGWVLTRRSLFSVLTAEERLALAKDAFTRLPAPLRAAIVERAKSIPDLERALPLLERGEYGKDTINPLRDQVREKNVLAAVRSVIERESVRASRVQIAWPEDKPPVFEVYVLPKDNLGPIGRLMEEAIDLAVTLTDESGSSDSKVTISHRPDQSAGEVVVAIGARAVFPMEKLARFIGTGTMCKALLAAKPWCRLTISLNEQEFDPLVSQPPRVESPEQPCTEFRISIPCIPSE